LRAGRIDRSWPAGRGDDPADLNRRPSIERFDDSAFRSPVVAALLEMLPVGTLLFAPDGVLLFANVAGRRLWAEAQAAAESGNFDAAVAHALLTGDVVREEAFEIRTRSLDSRAGRGSARWILLGSVPVRDEHGDVEAIVMTLEDITARTQLARLQPLLDSLSRL
jgi:PAS domain S-box-containing protein